MKKTTNIVVSTLVTASVFVGFVGLPYLVGTLLWEYEITVRTDYAFCWFLGFIALCVVGLFVALGRLIYKSGGGEEDGERVSEDSRVGH